MAKTFQWHGEEIEKGQCPYCLHKPTIDGWMNEACPNCETTVGISFEYQEIMLTLNRSALRFARDMEREILHSLSQILRAVFRKGS